MQKNSKHGVFVPNLVPYGCYNHTWKFRIFGHMLMSSAQTIKTFKSNFSSDMLCRIEEACLKECWIRVAVGCLQWVTHRPIYQFQSNFLAVKLAGYSSHERVEQPYWERVFDGKIIMINSDFRILDNIISRNILGRSFNDPHFFEKDFSQLIIEMVILLYI